MESFWLCQTCLFAVAYDDFSALSLYYTDKELEQRMAAIHEGVRELTPLSADFDSETGLGIDDLSTSPCDACHCSLHGARHRFTRL